MPTLPTINNSDFFVADDIREEQGTKKLTVLGLYAGGDILYPKGTNTGFIIPKLSFMIRLKDCDGKWSTEWKIRDKNNKEMASSNAPFDMTKLPSTFHLLVLNGPVKVESYGTYKLVVILDGNELEFPFRIDTH